MKNRQLFLIAFMLAIFLAGCQPAADENLAEIPVTYENLTVEDLAEQSTLPVKLPKKLPFEPVDAIITLDDYKDLYEDGKPIEEILVRYIKTYREGRYVDVVISNLKQENEEGETVLLENGREAIYADDEIGQLLFWTEGDVSYRLVYYTSEKVNEGQEPLSLEAFLEIANSFEPI